jgi:hypothetical protein
VTPLPCPLCGEPGEETGECERCRRVVCDACLTDVETYAGSYEQPPESETLCASCAARWE